MRKNVRSVAALAGTVACGLSFAHKAQAHIDMVGELKGRGGDQKSAPCEGEPRSDTPYEFEPGATIKLGVMELVPHDGYFRIAFDDDGTDFKDPQSIAPLNPDRYGPGKKCQGTAQDRCGESDFCSMTSDGSGPTVLWDNLDPHLIDDVSFGQMRFWNVKLPNVECDNCTLQIIQVMEDPAGDAHGPFDGKNDIYYRCVDIVLRKGVGKTPGTTSEPVDNDGMQCTKASQPSDGGVSDSGVNDGGVRDSGVNDSGIRDSGVRDGGANDGDDDSGDDDGSKDDDMPSASAGSKDGCSASSSSGDGASLSLGLLALAWAARRRPRTR